MFYLTLAIISSAAIALIFKYSENTNSNRYLITSTNYFVASMISLFMIISKGLLIEINKTSSFFSDVKHINSNLIFSPYSSIIWALLVGFIAGFFFFLSFIYYQKSVKENGISVTGMIAKLGILIPMIFSIIIWKEYPSTIQWLGIILALTSIILVNMAPKSLENFDLKPGLILLFFFGGLAEFSNKIFQKYAISDYKDVFLFTVFFTAFIISIFFTIKEKKPLRKKDILTGIAVGIPNLFSSYFLILSLNTLTTSVAFPLYSAGSIVLINLGGYFIFKEEISRKNKVAILMTIIALVLINL